MVVVMIVVSRVQHAGVVSIRVRVGVVVPAVIFLLPLFSTFETVNGVLELGVAVAEEALVAEDEAVVFAGFVGLLDGLGAAYAVDIVDGWLVSLREVVIPHEVIPDLKAYFEDRRQEDKDSTYPRKSMFVLLVELVAEYSVCDRVYVVVD